MLRFILARILHDSRTGCTEHLHETIDISVPELERALFAGGKGPMGYDMRRLIGVELLSREPGEDQ